MSPWRATSIYTDGIIDLVARHQRPPGLPSGFQGGIALTDGTIHHQDIGGHSGYSAPFRSTDSLLCPGTLQFSSDETPSHRGQVWFDTLGTGVGLSSGRVVPEWVRNLKE
jgi:hypothetical protein